MRLVQLFGAVTALALGASACEDDHLHARGHVHKRAYPSVPLPPPYRPLEWGDINILHTTDTHGWLLGHQEASFPEPNYSGDFGDFASFVKHMKEIAKKKGVDLLLVDSGDLHDGTGLSDGFPPGGINAHDSNEFFVQLPYDVLAIGNHELYVYNNTLDMHNNFAPAFPGRYLSSNVNITLIDDNGTVSDVPVGSRFAKFKTEQGRKVTAFGILYDFTGNDDNTTVQRVEDMVKEQWFLEAIADEPNFFLLAGHMAISDDNWPIVFDAIRAVHESTPILILGGHFHIRDCAQLDGRSMSLASGRYMETVGWLSAKLDCGKSDNITFSRRYLDPNVVTYQYHTRHSNDSFWTEEGQSITQGLLDLSDRFNLTFQFGTAPQDYTLSRAPYPSNDSLLTLFIDQASPVALAINNTRADIPNLMIINSGSQRFDIYSGPFTRNDQFTTSPFLDEFLYLPNITLSVANAVLDELNQQGEARRKRSLREDELWAKGYVDGRYMEWLEDMDRRWAQKRELQNLTLGYVTTDSCPGVGDDTAHAPLPFYSVPDFVSSSQPDVADDEGIDLVFVDFIEDQFLEILNSKQSDKEYTRDDVQVYSPIMTNEILGVFAQEVWN